MKTKKKRQVKHFHRRFNQRVGRIITKSERQDIIKLIQTNRANFIERQSGRVTIWDVPSNGEFIRVVYDNKTKNVVTILTKSDGGKSEDFQG